MMPAITLLLDTMQIPYTGCSTEAMVAAANKITVKEQLVHAGLPTPDWITPDFGFRISDFGLKEEHKNPQSLVPSGRRFPKYIIKSVLEHASFEMNDEAIIGAATRAEIIEVIRDRIAQTGRPFFAERFIEGREFNLSLLGDGPRVLPPAEIDFSAFPAGKARIVGQRAKWDAGAFEFHNTPRRYDFPPADTSLIERLSSLAIKCWRQFRLGGYARVDFRVDEDGQPWILEINTNPCIAPTSGFAAALEEAGISYDNGIQLILDDALARDSGARCASKEIDGKPNTNLARLLKPLRNG
jgi:D-alanine-D-alanine ligase